MNTAGRIALSFFLGLTTAGEPVYGEPSDWDVRTIRADEYRFVPDRITAKAGRPLSLVVENRGHEPHEFRSTLFKGVVVVVQIGESSIRAMDIQLVDVAPGTSAAIKILDPPAGEFDFLCRIPSHHGMDGVLIIQGESDQSTNR